MICHDSWRYPPPLRIRGPASELRQTGLYFVFFFAAEPFFRRGIRRNPPFPFRHSCGKNSMACIISQIARIGRPRGDGAAAAPERRLSASVRKCHDSSGFSVSGQIPGFNASPLSLGEGSVGVAADLEPGIGAAADDPSPYPSPKERGIRAAPLGTVRRCQEMSCFVRAGDCGGARSAAGRAAECSYNVLFADVKPCCGGESV